MFNGILTKTYLAPSVDENEILRYAGCKGDADGVRALLKDCILEAENVLSYRVCYRVMEKQALLDLFPYREVEARLKTCEYAVVFAATLGLGIDRLISKYAEVSPARALMFQAIGAERVEGLCDVFCKEIKDGASQKGYCIGGRFSPGYGRFPLEAQNALFSVLDCSRKIGLTLNERLLMSPTKSVTAVVGIGKTTEEETIGCAVCEKKECAFRSEKK